MEAQGQSHRLLQVGRRCVEASGHSHRLSSLVRSISSVCPCPLGAGVVTRPAEVHATVYHQLVGEVRDLSADMELLESPQGERSTASQINMHEEIISSVWSKV